MSDIYNYKINNCTFTFKKKKIHHPESENMCPFWSIWSWSSHLLKGPTNSLVACPLSTASTSTLCRFMDNLQTEVLEIEFLTYSKGMTTISEEDFARILLRYTTVDNISSYLKNVHQSIPDEKVKAFALLIPSTNTILLTKAEWPLDQHTLNVSHYCWVKLGLKKKVWRVLYLELDYNTTTFYWACHLYPQIYIPYLKFLLNNNKS